MCYGQVLACGIAEMYQSREIIKQCIENMPGGPINIDDRKIVPPPRIELGQQHGSRYPPLQALDGRLPPAGRRGVCPDRIRPRARWAFYIVSDGTNRPYRAHQRPACFMNLQALSRMCEGRLIADVVAIIGSIDIILGEIDR